MIIIIIRIVEYIHQIVECFLTAGAKGGVQSPHHRAQTPTNTKVTIKMIIELIPVIIIKLVMTMSRVLI